mgnify:CR=1 FL=1
MTNLYILNENGNPVAEPDLAKWSEWFKTSERRVANEKIGDSTVSTVFLGANHSFSGSGGAVLWETMVFGGKLDEEQHRCCGSREQALVMHERMAKKVRAAQ